MKGDGRPVIGFTDELVVELEYQPRCVEIIEGNAVQQRATVAAFDSLLVEVHMKAAAAFGAARGLRRESSVLRGSRQWVPGGDG